MAIADESSLSCCVHRNGFSSRRCCNALQPAPFIGPEQRGTPWARRSVSPFLFAVSLFPRPAMIPNISLQTRVSGRADRRVKTQPAADRSQSSEGNRGDHRQADLSAVHAKDCRSALQHVAMIRRRAYMPGQCARLALFAHSSRAWGPWRVVPFPLPPFAYSPSGMIHARGTVDAQLESRTCLLGNSESGA